MNVLEYVGDLPPPNVPFGATTGVIVGFGVLGLLYAILRAIEINRISLNPADVTRSLESSERLPLSVNDAEAGSSPSVEVLRQVQTITDAIAEGARAFLFAEYKILAIFIALFGAIIFFADGATNGWAQGGFSTLAFVLGGVTSIISGYIGMAIAVRANGRTCVKAYAGYPEAFRTAFKAGCVMGFALVSLGMLILFAAISAYRPAFTENTRLFEAIAGYGLGGSSVALFGRVGGGIYTKAADVGADLVGKVEKDIPEDDPRNPAVVADNVGDNVGDIAGMGADLFGSLAESTCAALVVASSSPTIGFTSEWTYMMFPLVITAFGIPVGLISSLVSANIRRVTEEKDIELELKLQLIISTIIATPVMLGVCYGFLPSFPFQINDTQGITWWKIFLCAASGLWAGLIIGYITEYYTSHSYNPVREVAESCRTGAATNVIYGLALGYKSVIIPVFALAIAIFVGYSLGDMYGIAIAALGILSTLTIGLTIDAYGPISDNAGGIAEMSGMGKTVRERTDALDAAGNTTAAIGKGFAIGSAAMVSLALFGAFVTKAGITGVDILKPFSFFGLLIGAMLPYAFSAMTMKSVGIAANAMVVEVRRQFREIPGLMEGTGKADYSTCVAISTRAALREMMLPGAMVMLAPLAMGFLVGVNALAGMLAGALVSGVQMAISASNTGGAWDNAKKYIEKGSMEGQKKGSDAHKAAVVGDTVGDPLKDTSGPSLNILIKLMAIISLVFAPIMVKIPYGGLLQWGLTLAGLR